MDNNSSTNSNLIDTIIPGVTRMQDVDSFVGTIVYIGPVASAKDPNEKYAGVIWDDASRGKHDGSVVCRRTNQLVRHFSCPNPCGASFLRLSKLDLGVPLDAPVFRQKYVSADSTELVAPNNLLPHTARTSQGRSKPIEFYGELKIRSRQQLEDLHTISLRRMGIARLDSTSSLQEFAHLKGLDLAGNLLADWKTVLQIMKQFPNLETFSIAANLVRDPKEEIRMQVEEDCQEAPFSSLQMINLNQCGITSVQTLLWIGKLLPKLQNLCLAHADLSKLDCESSLKAASSFQQLQQLDLTECQLSSWDQQIVPLCSSLPHLESLNLDENPVHTTTMMVEEESTNNTSSIYFPQLQSLQLAGTQISQWQGLDGLARFPKLTALRFRRCPLTSSLGTGAARALTIARVATLTKLNASQITPKERTEAERRYVSSIACQLLQLPEDQRDDFLKENHSPFSSLMDKHREAIASTMMVDTATGESSPRSVTTSTTVVVVNVTIKSMAPSSCHQEPLTRRLPGSLPIKRIKAMCARSFGLDPDLQRLHFCTEFDAFPTEMDDDEHTLVYYGVSDGATIFMNEIDVEEVQRQQEKTKQEQKSKLEEQEALEMRKQKHKQQLLQSS